MLEEDNDFVDENANVSEEDDVDELESEEEEMPARKAQKVCHNQTRVSIKEFFKF